MINRTNTVFIFIVSFLLLSPNMSFAGGGGGGGGLSGGKVQVEEPQYYSLEDLRNGLSQRLFYFNNSNKPDDALVSLGYFPFYAACASKKKSVVSVVSKAPSKFGINSLKITSNWRDNKEIVFDWDGFKNMVGPEPCILIFTRGNGIGAEIVKRFSNWSHVAITDDSDDSSVFESTPDTGAQVNNARKTWKNLTYYTCRRIKSSYDPQSPIVFGNLQYALKMAENKYRGIPYYPKVETCMDLFGVFLYRWSDKNDMDSMYCSKLVYHTFKDYVNFDTKRTGVDSCIIGDRSRPIGSGFFGWLGISPDDIYYSNTLDHDFFYSNNVTYL